MRPAHPNKRCGVPDRAQASEYASCWVRSPKRLLPACRWRTLPDRCSWLLLKVAKRELDGPIRGPGEGIFLRLIVGRTILGHSVAARQLRQKPSGFGQNRRPLGPAIPFVDT